MSGDFVKSSACENYCKEGKILVFSSLTFWFIYLPVVLLLYYITPKKARNIVLFAVSLGFYGWGEPVYILLMLVTILINYVAGFLIGKSKENDNEGIPDISK